MSKKFKVKSFKKNRRKRWLGLSLGLFLIVGLSGLFYYLTLQKSASTKVSRPVIALVNEDKSQTFDHQPYQFGRDFVNMVSNDNSYNWKVLSRSVADRAYSDGAIDAVIYLPQDFSQKLLTLEAINPEKAKVSYKVTTDKRSELTQEKMTAKINGLLYGLNTSVVKMYFSSVAGNVASAETYMGDAVGSQGQLLTGLSQQVFPPFQSATQGYGGVIKTADLLKNQNTEWVTRQNIFTHDTTDSLTKLNAGIFQGQKGIQTFSKTFSEMMLANSKNANLALRVQNKQDADYYFKIFDALNTSAKDRTDKMGGPDQSLLTDLSKKVSDYQTVITGVRDNIDKQNNNLIDHTQQLYDLEGNLLTQFFNFPPNGPDGIPMSGDDPNDTTSASLIKQYVNSDNARIALANKLDETVGVGTIPEAYQNKIVALLQQLYLNQDAQTVLGNYLTALQDLDSTLSSSDIEAYKAEIRFVSQFATAFGITGAGWNPVTPANPTSPFVTHQIKVTVPAGQTATVVAIGAAGISSTLDGALTQGGSSVSIPAQTIDQTHEVEFTIPIKSDSTTVTYFQNIGSAPGTTERDIYAVDPASPIQADLKNNFKNITTMLSKIDEATSLIEFLYGAPTDDYTAFRPSATPTEADFTHQSTESVYNKYDNIDFSALKTTLSEKDVQDFMDEGKRNLEILVGTIDANGNVTTDSSQEGQIQKVLAIRQTLQAESDTLNRNLPETYFGDSLTQLKDWYNQTVTALDAAYKKWLPNQADQLSTLNWAENLSDATVPGKNQNTSSSQDGKNSSSQSGKGNTFTDWGPIPGLEGKISAPPTESSQETEDNSIHGSLPGANGNIFGSDTSSSNSQGATSSSDASLSGSQGATSTTESSSQNNDNASHPSNVSQTDEKDLPENTDNLYLYTNQPALDQLYQNFDVLYGWTGNVVTATKAGAAAIPNNSSEFENLADQAKTTSTRADTVLKETSQIIQTGTRVLSNSKDYYKNFQKTLANTREKKADTNHIYDFFANPISGVNLSSAKKLIQGFDWRWVVLFMLGLLLGVVCTGLRRLHSEEKVEEASGDGWEN